MSTLRAYGHRSSDSSAHWADWEGLQSSLTYQEWIGHKGQGWQSSQDFTSAMAPTPHRPALSWIHGAELHVLCAPKASGTHILPGGKQLHTLCQRHSLPTWALGPAVLTHSRFKYKCASFLGQYTEKPFHGSPVSAKSEQCKIYTDSHLLQVQGKIYMYLHYLRHRVPLQRQC